MFPNPMEKLKVESEIHQLQCEKIGLQREFRFISASCITSKMPNLNTLTPIHSHSSTTNSQSSKALTRNQFKGGALQ